MIDARVVGAAIPARYLPQWQPAVGGVLFLAGLVFTLLALSRGDVIGALAPRSMLAALGATAYACFDVLVQKWSPVWRTGRFVPIAAGAAA